MKIHSNKLLAKRYRADGKAILDLNAQQIDAVAAIEDKLQTNQYALEAIDCLLCGEENFDLLAEKDRYGLKVSTVICKNCGLIQTNPRMTQTSYADFYDNHYRQLYSGSSLGTETFFKNQYNHGKSIFNFIAQHLDLKDKVVVEVGAGAGGILSYFKEQGSQVFGVDLGSSYINFGKEKGIQLFCGDINLIFEKGIQPNLVIYSHVLEHILAPKKEIEQWSSYFKEGDMIYIEVPGLDNLTKNYRNDFLRFLQNAHTLHFTLTSLKELMLMYGFEMVRGNENVQALFVKKSSAQKKEISNQYAVNLHILKKYEQKRKAIFSSQNLHYTFNKLKNSFKRFVVSVLRKIKIKK